MLDCWCSAARLTCQAQWHSEHQHMCLGFPWTLCLPERATVQWSPGKKVNVTSENRLQNLCRWKKCLDLDKRNMLFKGRGKVCSEATTYLSRCRAIREGELRHFNTWIELQSHRPSISVWLLRVARWIFRIQWSGMDYFWYMLLLAQSEF